MDTAKPTVCVDVDNVLADYTDGLRRYVRERCGDAYPCPDPVEYDFSLTGGWPFTGSPESYLDWHRLAVSHGLYAGLDPLPGAGRNVTRLRDAGYRIVVSTTRGDDGDATRQWLDRHGIPYDALHHGEKTDVRFDVLIDDRPATLNACERLPGLLLRPDVAYCMGAPGVAYRSWDEAARIILGRDA